MYKIVFKKPITKDEEIILEKIDLPYYAEHPVFSVKGESGNRYDYNIYNLERDGYCDVYEKWKGDYLITHISVGEFDTIFDINFSEVKIGSCITKDLYNSPSFYVSEVDTEGRIWGKWMTL